MTTKNQKDSIPDDIAEMNPQQRAEFEAALVKYDGPGALVSSIKEYDRLKTEPRARVSFRTKIPSLDKHFGGGCRGGEVIVVSGPTKHGKTTLCRTLTRNLFSDGVAALWFSYEMAYLEFLETFTYLPDFYLPNELRSRALKWIEKRILEGKLKYNVRAVFIDHLHFLFDMARVKNVSLEIGALVRSIKTIAVRHNVVIFLISHLTKTKLDEEPNENDLRDSSFIAQETDSLLIVWRKKARALSGEIKYTNQTTVSVRFHRRTGVMAEKITLNYVKGWLEEDAGDVAGGAPEQPKLLD